MSKVWESFQLWWLDFKCSSLMFLCTRTSSQDFRNYIRCLRHNKCVYCKSYRSCLNLLVEGRLVLLYFLCEDHYHYVYSFTNEELGSSHLFDLNRRSNKKKSLTNWITFNLPSWGLKSIFLTLSFLYFGHRRINEGAVEREKNYCHTGTFL